MAKNLILDPILACMAQILPTKILFSRFTSISSETMLQAINLCNLKEN